MFHNPCCWMLFLGEILKSTILQTLPMKQPFLFKLDLESSDFNTANW